MKQKNQIENGTSILDDSVPSSKLVSTGGSPHHCSGPGFKCRRHGKPSEPSTKARHWCETPAPPCGPGNHQSPVKITGEDGSCGILYDSSHKGKLGSYWLGPLQIVTSIVMNDMENLSCTGKVMN